MASFPGYPAPHTLVPDGLQVRDDWEMPPHTTPVPSASSSTPLPSSSSSYDCYYEPHDPTDCVHARWLCDQRYADLQALMADLERLQCRCERSTWGRTKSFFGSLKKRALSLRSRRKSQELPELEAGREAEWPSEDDYAPSTGELPAVSKPAELAPNQAYIPELAASYLFASYPNAPSDPAPRMHLYPSSSTSYTHLLGFGQAGYDTNPGMASFPQMAYQPLPQAQAPQFYELAAQVPDPNMHTAPWYSGPPAGSLGISPVSPSTASASGNHPLISPKSSISSVSSLRIQPWSPPLSFVSPESSISSVSSMPTDAITVTVPGAPIYTSHTTYSPGEYGDDPDDVAPYDRPLFMAQQHSFDSTTTVVEVAELADSSPGSLSKPAQWLQDSTCSRLSELEGFVPFAKPTMPQPPQHLSQIQPTEPLELAAKTNVQLNADQGQWQASQMTERQQERTTVIADNPWSFFQPQPTPVRPGPRPLVSHTRQNSYDSTASTVLDVLIPDDDQDAEALESTNHPPNPPQAVFEELPSQQRTAAVQPSPFRRQKTQREPDFCLSCNFSPKGAGQRRKMEKHKQTDGHRRKTGQDIGGETKRHACWICPSTFNREDNLWQHIKKFHGVQRKKQMWRELGQSLRLAV